MADVKVPAVPLRVEVSVTYQPAGHVTIYTVKAPAGVSSTEIIDALESAISMIREHEPIKTDGLRDVYLWRPVTNSEAPSNG